MFSLRLHIVLSFQRAISFSFLILLQEQWSHLSEADAYFTVKLSEQIMSASEEWKSWANGNRSGAHPPLPNIMSAEAEYVELVIKRVFHPELLVSTLCSTSAEYLRIPHIGGLTLEASLAHATNRVQGRLVILAEASGSSTQLLGSVIQASESRGLIQKHKAFIFDMNVCSWGTVERCLQESCTEESWVILKSFPAHSFLATRVWTWLQANRGRLHAGMRLFLQSTSSQAERLSIAFNEALMNSFSTEALLQSATVIKVDTPQTWSGYFVHALSRLDFDEKRTSETPADISIRLAAFCATLGSSKLTSPYISFEAINGFSHDILQEG